MSENFIEFSLSDSKQRDSWLNSSHRTLDADIRSNAGREKQWQRSWKLSQWMVKIPARGVPISAYCAYHRTFHEFCILLE